ncbi:MAG: zinc metalloprotease HtpX [Desulfobacterales bacterium]|nr:zinc metalloprotease HtpX [Desulfobacterales bacterium]
MGNRIKTTVLLGILTVFIIWVGQLIGGRNGMFIAFILAVGMNFFSYWFSDKIVLSIYNAQEVTRNEAPYLYHIVANLSNIANIPMPRVYIIPEESPNAFATGRNPDNAVVAVTEGLLNMMDREELKGVIAHELSHIKNRDILIGSIAATLAGAVMILADMARWSAMFGGVKNDNEEEGGGGLGIFGIIVMSILAPIAATLIQMAISRSREYLADSSAASIVGHPEGLARALEKLGAYSHQIPMDAKPATAHMFIVNPLSGGSIMNFFSTHPPIEKRVANLRGSEYFNKYDEQQIDVKESRGKNYWDNLR